MIQKHLKFLPFILIIHIFFLSCFCAVKIQSSILEHKNQRSYSLEILGITQIVTYLKAKHEKMADLVLLMTSAQEFTPKIYSFLIHPKLSSYHSIFSKTKIHFFHLLI